MVGSLPNCYSDFRPSCHEKSFSNPLVFWISSRREDYGKMEARGAICYVDQGNREEVESKLNVYQLSCFLI